MHKFRLTIGDINRAGESEVRRMVDESLVEVLKHIKNTPTLKDDVDLILDVEFVLRKCLFATRVVPAAYTPPKEQKNGAADSHVQDSR